MPDDKNVDVILDDDALEASFNEAMDELHKSLGASGVKSLWKANEPEDEDFDDEDFDDEDLDDEDFDDDDSEPEGPEFKKSVTDLLSEDPEAAAAMDVEPYLYQLAKAIDESIGSITNMVEVRLNRVERLVKSGAKLNMVSAQLQKSIQDMVKSIGGTPMRSGSIVRLAKSRFGDSNAVDSFGSMEILAKSREWVRDKKIDLIEAGKIEARLNKGLLGKVNDNLDVKVASLIREGK